MQTCCHVRLAVVSNSHGHQSLAVAQHRVQHRRPGVHVPIVGRKVRAEAQINELVLPRQQDIFNVSECAVQLIRILFVGQSIKDAKVIR